MSKVTDAELRECIKNINHNSDNTLKMMQEGFVRNDEQHNNLLMEMKDQKQEMIMLRTQTNSLIMNIGSNNTKILIAMIGLVSASIAVVAWIVRGGV
ncbi:MAG: hypothetical protein WC307_05255 [Candidatus Nanoarchaeia archaeon]|jgi:hypothetical protein